MCSNNTQLTGQKKPTPLWSKIVKITNYGIKYTSCQLKILQKTNLKVKISKTSMKFVLASDGRNLIRLEGMIMQLSRFVNENRKKNRQNASLNEKFIQKVSVYA